MDMKFVFGQEAEGGEKADENSLSVFVDGMCTLAFVSGAEAVGMVLNPPFGEGYKIWLSDYAQRSLRLDVSSRLARYPSQTPDDEGHQTNIFVRHELKDEASVHAGSIVMAFPADFAPQAAERLLESFAALVYAHILSHLTVNRAELDVASEMRRADRFRRQAELDQLTRLDNRVTFRSKVEERMDDPDRDWALILIDIDKFKSVNDLYGHGFGDRYLQQIASAIEHSFPRAEAKGRLGGDEFAVFLPLARKGRMPEERLRTIVEEEMARFSVAVQRSVAKLGRPDLGHVSQGAALGPIQARGYDRLFEMADAALYSAKTKSRSMPTIYRASEHDSYSFRLLHGRFVTALEKRQIVPYFQPLMNLRTGNVYGYEALARWMDPERGVLPPKRFSAIFTDPTLAPKLTRDISAAALGFLGDRISKRSLPDREVLSLNLTAFELVQPEFVFELENLMTASGLDWVSLVLEVTESTMLGKVNGQSFRTLAELRSRGARIALDDFGTGYGGLQHLVDWPVDILKLDKSFLIDLAPGSRRAMVIRGMVAMAQDLGLKVVAEGVETWATHEFLTGIGCDYGQGYFYSRPFAGEELLDFDPSEFCRSTDLGQTKIARVAI